MVFALASKEQGARRGKLCPEPSAIGGTRSRPALSESSVTQIHNSALMTVRELSRLSRRHILTVLLSSL